MNKEDININKEEKKKLFIKNKYLFLLLLLFFLWIIFFFLQYKYRTTTIPKQPNSTNKQITLNLPEQKIKEIKNAIFYDNNEYVITKSGEYRKAINNYYKTKINYLKNCLNIKDWTLYFDSFYIKNKKNNFKNKKIYYVDSDIINKIIEEWYFIRNFKNIGCMIYQRNNLGQYIDAKLLKITKFDKIKNKKILKKYKEKFKYIFKNINYKNLYLIKAYNGKK